MRRNTLASILAVAIAVGSCTEAIAPPDSITPPGNVTVTLVGPNTVRVTWTAPPEAEFVESYSVFRDGVKIGESKTTFYLDDGVVQGVTYKYRVSANGQLGIVSELSSESASATLTVPDVTPPTISSTNPAASATGVAHSSTVSAVFSEPMDPATITAATFFLKNSAGVVIPGTVSYNAATRTAQLTPTAALPNGAALSATITTGVKDVPGNSLQSDFTFSFTTRDEAPPSVVSTLPAAGATGVAVTSAITVTFSEAMDQSTLTTSTFTVTPTAGGAPVTGTLSYDASTNRSVLNTSANLASSTEYTVTIAGSVKDQAGNAMGTAFSFSFTTADIIRPHVVSVSPIDGATDVALNAAIKITFSEPMDPATIKAASIALRLTSSGAFVDGLVTYDAATMTATITPSAGLTFSTGYTVTSFAGGAKDLAGNPVISNFVSTFVTTDAPDSSAPSVLSVSPLDGASDVPITTAVSVSFSEAMNPATINGTTVTLTNAATAVVVPATVAYDAGSKTATLTPSSSLAFGNSYTLTVSTGASDLAGNGLGGTFASTFATTPVPDNVAPSVLSTLPVDAATNVSILTTVTVTFSEAMNPATINGTTVTLKNAGTSAAVPATVAYDAGSKTATLIPTSPLSFANAYALTVTTGASDLAGNGLGGTFASTFTTSSVPDNTPPVVLSTVPVDAATNVSIVTPITVTFSEAMNPATINTSTIVLKLAGPGTVISGSVGYNGATRTGTFTPAAGTLAFATTYTLTASGATDVAGNAMTAPFIVAFTTQAAPDLTPPTVTGNSPANGAVSVATTVAPTISFSEAMNAATINASTITLRVTATSAAVSGTVSYSSATNTATFTPSASLSGSTGYTLSATTGAKDLAGNSLASTFTSTFTTADVTPPGVASTSPVNSAVNVPVNTAVAVTFNEPMNASTINGSTITLRVTATSAAVSGTVSYNAGTNTATFTPAASLSGGPTGYTLAVTTGVKDLAGNSLASPFTSSFTTADVTPPTVSSTSPVNGSVGVLITTSFVTVTFSEAMNAATINTSTITLKRGPAPDIEEGTVTYDAATRTATFTPTWELLYNSPYTITVTTGAKDVAGNPLASNVTSTFQTIQYVFSVPYFRGTTTIANDTQPQIHVHLKFSQDGHVLGRAANCQPLPAAECDLLPQNQAGLDAIGPLDDTNGGSTGLAATVTQITGTFTDPGISFTITLQNGRTFSFSGTVENSQTMHLTMTGATLPGPMSILLDRFEQP